MKKEVLEFKVYTENLIKYFGEQNFENKYSAVYEIIKNSHDAYADNINIIFEKDTIYIIDDGKGMRRKDIIENWMYIGKSEKEKITDDNRVQTGEKGIGRFALAKLGNIVIVESKQEGMDGVKWETDWQTNHISYNNKTDTGTTIIIKKLNEKWNKSDIDYLFVYLSKVKKDNSAQMFITYDNKKMLVNNIFGNLEAKRNYFIKFDFLIDKYILRYNIENYLFNDEVFKNSITSYEATKKDFIDLEKELMHVDNFEVIRELDKITGEFYFGFAITEESREKFMYKDLKYVKPSILKEKLDGIILYRNGFSIAGFEGNKDWTKLQQRAQKSPAAASHPTGSFKFRKNNILGFVEIDKQNNNNLIDLSNRQGLIENDTFTTLVNILDIYFKKVEEYYQNIVRDVDKFIQNKHEKSITPYIKRVIEDVDKDIKKQRKKRVDYFELDRKIESDFAKSEKKESLKEDFKILNYKKVVLADKVIENEDKGKDFLYAQTLLEALATQGILIESLAHDIKVNVANLPGIALKLEKALKRIDIWDKINEEEYIERNATNIPNKLSELDKSTKYIARILNEILDNMRKSKFKVECINLETYFEGLITKYKEKNPVLNINNVIEVDEINVDEITLDIIFYNLIDNSIKHNPHSNDLRIDIKLSKNENGLIVINYSDNGRGLHDKYISDRNRILRAHETSKLNSHGLGLWIVNERVIRLNGKVNILESDVGFKILIMFKGE